jgi:Ser/Thr protein kinase RdoA (MazF antagonist)
LLLGDPTHETTYVLQRINTQVFQDLEAIEVNQTLAAAHLKKMAPDYYFVQAIRGTDGRMFQESEGETWRLLPHIRDSVTFEQATSADQIYEAALAFGTFAGHLDSCELGAFRETIPQFHDLTKYSNELRSVLETAEPNRLQLAKKALNALNSNQEIARLATAMRSSDQFPWRVLHHDAKMGNILLHKNTHKALCIIDLDTIMRGKIYSDIGDLIRSSVSIADDKSTDVHAFEVRPHNLQAALEGYREAMHKYLTIDEKEYLPKAGHIMLYMQAVRFLADFLRGDTYYKTEYGLQNLDRAEGQLAILSALR